MSNSDRALKEIKALVDQWSIDENVSTGEMLSEIMTIIELVAIQDAYDEEVSSDGNYVADYIGDD